MGTDIGTIVAGAGHVTTHGHMMDSYGWGFGGWWLLLLLATVVLVGIAAAIVFLAVTDSKQ